MFKWKCLVCNTKGVYGRFGLEIKIGNELAGGRERRGVNSTLRCTNIREGQNKEFAKRPEKRQIRSMGRR